jgi:hypothetical protein
MLLARRPQCYREPHSVASRLLFHIQPGIPPSCTLSALYSSHSFTAILHRTRCGPHSLTSIFLFFTPITHFGSIPQTQTFRMRFSSVGALLALAVGVVAQAPVPYVLSASLVVRDDVELHD